MPLPTIPKALPHCWTQGEDKLIVHIILAFDKNSYAVWRICPKSNPSIPKTWIFHTSSPTALEFPKAFGYNRINFHEYWIHGEMVKGNILMPPMHPYGMRGEMAYEDCGL